MIDSNIYFKIGQAARGLNISVELIRMYEREGILLPRKTDSGQRVFTAEDINWITCIRRMITEKGMNMEGIRRMLSFMPCWSMKNCSIGDKVSCPAYTSSIKPCWMIKDDVKGECKDLDCRECTVYQSAAKCENLKELFIKYNNQ